LRLGISLLGGLLYFGKKGIVPILRLKGSAPTSPDYQQCQNYFFHLFVTALWMLPRIVPQATPAGCLWNLKTEQERHKTRRA
jgi:hypothetical protein